MVSATEAVLPETRAMEFREASSQVDETLDWFDKRKEAANELYRQKRFQDALDQYVQLLQDLDSKLATQRDAATCTDRSSSELKAPEPSVVENGVSDSAIADDEEDASSPTGSDPESHETTESVMPVLRAILRLNMAACALEMGQYEDTIDHCNWVLTYEPSNLKALYRCGKAHFMLKQYSKADYFLRESLKQLSRTGRRGSSKMLREVNRMLQEIDKHSSKRFRGMFDRLDLYADRELPKQLKRSSNTLWKLGILSAIVTVGILVLAYVLMLFMNTS